MKLIRNVLNSTLNYRNGRLITIYTVIKSSRRNLIPRLYWVIKEMVTDRNKTFGNIWYKVMQMTNKRIVESLRVFADSKNPFSSFHRSPNNKESESF